MNFGKLAKRAKQVVDKRGGMDALKEDAGELRDIARGEGSVKDKATKAAGAVKDPGAKGPDPKHRAAKAGGAGRKGAGTPAEGAGGTAESPRSK